MHHFFLSTQPIWNHVWKKETHLSGEEARLRVQFICNYTNIINTKPRSSEPTGQHSVSVRVKQTFNLLSLSLWKARKYSFFSLEQCAMYVNGGSFTLLCHVFFSLGNLKVQSKYFILLYLCSRQLLSLFFLNREGDTFMTCPCLERELVAELWSEPVSPGCDLEIMQLLLREKLLWFLGFWFFSIHLQENNENHNCAMHSQKNCTFIRQF